MFRQLALTVLLAAFPAAVQLSAAPRLGVELPQELDRSPCDSLGTCPIYIEEGQNGPASLIIQAKNLGDGDLNVTATGAPSSWLGANVGSMGPCLNNISEMCQPIALQLNTAALPAGEHYAELTIEAPGAIDAPRRIPIRVRIGGDIPSQIDFYVPPTEGAADFVDFQTPAGPAPTFEKAGNFLSISSNGLGSFRYLHTHRLIGRYTAANANVGENNGSITVSGSSFGADNREVPVKLHVTAEPILRLSMDQLTITTAEGIAPNPQYLAISNGGLGDLTVDSVEVATENGGEWLTASTEAVPGFVQVTPAVDGLAVGRYTGTVRVNGNAVNAPQVIPVALEIKAAGAPTASYQGTVDAATFQQPVSPGSLISIFGEQLSYQLAGAESTPLPTELGEASVTIDGISAPLVFASYGQLNVQVPNEVGTGARVVQVARGGTPGNSTMVEVEQRVPRLFLVGIGQYGAIINATQGNFPLPADQVPAGVNGGPAHPGDVISLYATGLGPATPVVPTGEAAPSSPLSQSPELPMVSFSRIPLGPMTTADFAGLAPGFVGLWQINVTIPQNAPTDEHTPITLYFLDGSRRSNTIEIPIVR